MYTIDFCVLILYPTTLSNPHESPGLLVEYRTMAFTNQDNMTSSFLIHIPWVSFPCTVALAKTSGTVLKSRGKSGHPVWFWILVEMPSTFTHSL